MTSLNTYNLHDLVNIHLTVGLTAVLLRTHFRGRTISVGKIEE